MEKHADLGKRMLDALSGVYQVRQLDVGPDARLAKKGMTFQTEAYEVADLGHLCILRMKAAFGLMKMETAVLSVFEKDVPLLNLDWVGAFGRETQIAELYDVQLQPWPERARAEFQTIKDRDADLPDPASKGAHWYDGILYPCSYHKAGKGFSDRLNRAAGEYISVFVRQLAEAPACDPAAKREKVRQYAETLFAQGGPAVDQVTNLFGPETARRLIVRHMYGV